MESWNINAFPTNFGANNPALQNAAFANTQAYLPYPQFGTINHMANTGHSSYHSGTIQYSKRYSGPGGGFVLHLLESPGRLRLGLWHLHRRRSYLESQPE